MTSENETRLLDGTVNYNSVVDHRSRQSIFPPPCCYVDRCRVWSNWSLSCEPWVERCQLRRDMTNACFNNVHLILYTIVSITSDADAPRDRRLWCNTMARRGILWPRNIADSYKLISSWIYVYLLWSWNRVELETETRPTGEFVFRSTCAPPASA